jgi:hypothetical protein
MVFFLGLVRGVNGLVSAQEVLASFSGLRSGSIPRSRIKLMMVPSPTPS